MEPYVTNPIGSNHINGNRGTLSRLLRLMDPVAPIQKCFAAPIHQIKIISTEKALMSVLSCQSLTFFASKRLQVLRTNLWVGMRSFRVSAPTHWNSMPHSVRTFL